MASASYGQTDFRGGEWSPSSQGRLTDPAIRTGLNVLRNSMPMIQGAWTRRPGSRFIALMKGGAAGVLKAFDFTTTQPYQLAFTDGWVRFVAGLSLLDTQDQDGAVYLANVQATNPVKIFTVNAIPAGWANGNTINFDLGSVPASCTDLLGRTFIIANISTGTQSFTLKDAITGLDVDGTSFVYNIPPMGSAPDLILKVFELATPYTGTSWSSLRTVQDEDTVLLLQGSIAPEVISEGAPFQINPAIFKDGPYLDVNVTTTTLTPSALTGTITLTASATTGINGGQGFIATDVGRLVRFRSAPPAWDSGTTYAKAAIVTGSDSNIYTSIQGGNLNHDPTTDNTSTYWQITGQTVTWTWLKITIVDSTTLVHATVEGVDLSAANATTQWRLGLFSDTTGWPTCGSYHESRLWLSGVVKNRLDGGTSNNVDVATGAQMPVGTFNFSPTATDGTVADANAVAATVKSNDVEAVFWMLSTDDGLIFGTQSAEWRIKASALDDPISPSSIQARRVSTYGCANIEPIQPGGQTVFVQRQQRRLLGHEQVASARYLAHNISKDADHLTVTGLAEITWQQEPNLNIWARREDGALVGATYKSETGGRDNFTGWHRHDLGTMRIVTSLQGGPAYDGLSDALYMVTNQTDVNAPDFNVHWIESLAPYFDAGSQDWQAFLIDGGANPSYAQRMAVANGDGFDGIRIFGLWNLNGSTVAPVLGGLDLGDRTVANGYVDIPFGSDPEAKFTLSFFTGLSNGTDYGIFATETGYVVDSQVTPPVAGEAVIAYVGDDVTVQGNGGAQAMNYAPDGSYVYQMSIGSTVPGMRKFNASSGVEVAQTARFMSPTVSVCHPNGHIYVSHGSGNCIPMEDISTDTATFGAGTTYGPTSSYLGGSDPSHFQCAFNTIVGFRLPDVGDFIVYNGIRAAQQTNEVTVLQVNQPAITFAGAHQFASFNSGKTATFATVGQTTTRSAIIYALEQPYTGTWPGDTSTQLYLWRCSQTDGGFGFVTSFIKGYAPADFDATWTDLSGCIGPMYDQADGNLMFFIATDAVVTNPTYLVKVNAWTGDVVWQIAWPDEGVFYSPDAQHMAITQCRGSTTFVRGTSGHHEHIVVDTIAGTITTTAINTGFGILGSQWTQRDGAATYFGDFSVGTGPAVTILGAYLPAHGNAASSKWLRFYLGDQYAYRAVTEYIVPVSLGASFTSQGQLLRPDGGEGGAQNGPGFGKLRRIHQHAVLAYRTRALLMGTTFSGSPPLRPVPFKSPGGTPYAAPSLFSGVVSTDPTESAQDYNGQLAWEVNRPYPATIPELGVFLSTSDK